MNCFPCILLLRLKSQLSCQSIYLKHRVSNLCNKQNSSLLYYLRHHSLPGQRLFSGVHALLMFIVFIYVYWCPAQFPYISDDVMSFKSNMTGVTSEAGTANPSGAPKFTLGFLWDSSCSIFSFLCSVLVHCLSFCPLSFGHCIVCPFSIVCF